MKGYRKDLAWIHDTGFSGFATRAAPGLLALLRRGGVARGSLVVDLGCGGGHWAEALGKAGYEVMGIDSSAAMIAMARKRAPRARLRRASMFRAGIPPCDAVTALGECVNYMFDAAGGRSRLSGLFRRVHAALRPGGLFLFDVAGPGRGGSGAGGSSRFVLGGDWAVLVNATEDPRTNILTRRITTFRRAGPGYRRTEEIHRLQLYRPSEVSALLRRCGFTVRRLGGYGRLRLPVAHAALRARRKS